MDEPETTMNKLSQVIAEAEQVRGAANAAFGALSSEQLEA